MTVFSPPIGFTESLPRLMPPGGGPARGKWTVTAGKYPTRLYSTKDFERIIALRARTKAIARHLAEFMGRTDRFAKTIVFCVNQEHADEMRRALNNLNTDLVQKYPDYVARVTSEEGKVGKGYLSRFQELETISPVILTTSQLLTTGVDAPTCKNVVLARVVNSMTEFKQIIGRGTRMREDYGKTWFNILDYTGSATRNFADSEFDGFPDIEEEITIDENGYETREEILTHETGEDDQAEDHGEYETGVIAGPYESGGEGGEPRKFYVDGGRIEIAAHLVYELDAEGNQLRVVQFTDYAAEKVRTLFTSADELQDRWADPLKREEVILELEERGIAFKTWPRQPASQTPIPSTCFAISPSIPRYARERNAPTTCARINPTSSTNMDRRLGKFSPHCSTSTPISGPANSASPMPCRCRRSPSTAT